MSTDVVRDEATRISEQDEARMRRESLCYVSGRLVASFCDAHVGLLGVLEDRTIESCWTCALAAVTRQRNTYFLDRERLGAELLTLQCEVERLRARVSALEATP